MIENELSKIGKMFNDMEQELSKFRLLEHIRPITDLSEVIRQERKKQKLTLKSLSELSGVSYSSLAKIESGDTNFNYKTLTLIIDALGLKLWIG